MVFNRTVILVYICVKVLVFSLQNSEGLVGTRHPLRNILLSFVQIWPPKWRVREKSEQKRVFSHAVRKHHELESNHFCPVLGRVPVRGSWVVSSLCKVVCFWTKDSWTQPWPRAASGPGDGVGLDAGATIHSLEHKEPSVAGTVLC